MFDMQKNRVQSANLISLINVLSWEVKFFLEMSSRIKSRIYADFKNAGLPLWQNIHTKLTLEN